MDFFDFHHIFFTETFGFGLFHKTGASMENSAALPLSIVPLRIIISGGASNGSRFWCMEVFL